MNPFKLIRKKINTLKQNMIKQEQNTWCFVPYGDDFTGNIKAVFEQAKKENIKIVILTSSISFIKYQEHSIIINSAINKYFFESSVIICDQMLSIYRFFKYIDLKKKPIVNVWHGIPIKNMFRTSIQNSNPFLQHEDFNFHIIASSESDAISMGKSFGIPKSKVHITGLPRIDFLFSTFDCMKEEEKKINELTINKKLILFAPTWRDDNNSYYQFSNDELINLSNFLIKFNCIIGIREHFHHKNNSYYNQLSSIGAINLDNREFTNIEVLLKKASLLITDYSSCYFDFLFLRKPCISFSFDYIKYNNKERGFLYDLHDVFERKLCFRFQDVINELENIMKSTHLQENDCLKFNKFFKFNDNLNTNRVISLVKQLTFSKHT
ncbi:CDP-glycerol glycerophosphotransferase family protein [Orbus sturtevantii]|uniref:CDP-glycerol glycerophosphotransferase family protein n=1 Tax=Orbus sturtevantii TaxID=3074109 RepID=UPI00370DAB82